jgi:hypothetical protein
VTTIYIPTALRQLVIEQAGNRCGYCLVHQELHYGPLEIEHIVPRSLGGSTLEQNLWLACRICNGYKSDRVDGIDPDTALRAPLFNPRRQAWSSHFRWSEDALELVGLTSVGRATVAALQLNSLARMKMRRRWISVGWHPPEM